MRHFICSRVTSQRSEMPEEPSKQLAARLLQLWGGGKSALPGVLPQPLGVPSLTRGSPAQDLEVAAVRPPLDGMFPSSHIESNDRTPKMKTTNMRTGLRPLATTCLGATRGGHWGHAGEEGPGELGELSWCFHPSQHGVTAPKGSSLFQGEGTAWMRG